MYRLRGATPDDVTFLEELRRSVFQELFVATFGGWDEARHLRQWSDCWEQGSIFVIEVNAERVGMIQLLDEPDTLYVGEFQVLPSQQRRGLGTQVLRDVLAQAHAQQRAVSLSLGLKNEGARRLYTRLGFRDTARSETHYHMTSYPAQ